MARAAVTGWTDHDRGPKAERGNGTRSAHRATRIREKRRRVPLVMPDADQSSDVIVTPWCGQKLQKRHHDMLAKAGGAGR